jgi:hypothetical protein
MQRQASSYQERSIAAMGVLARILGGVIWVLVAVLLVMLIFRVFGSYVGTINKLAAPGGGM